MWGISSVKFYTKFSLIFLILILLFAISLIYINYYSLGRLYDRVEQQLNRNYALSISQELQPIIEMKYTTEMIKEEIHYMMVLNPMVEIYLLNDQGEIMSFFTSPGDKLSRKRVDIFPVEQFIYNGSTLPILGDDPKDLTNKKPFSAAPISLGGDMGYIYVILRGRSFDRNLQTSSFYYFRESGMFSLLLVTTLILIIATILFSSLTKPLNSLVKQVKLLKSGQYSNKKPIVEHDELGLLTNTFYDMANRLSQTVNNLRNLSHDLRSPLTTIKGALETIEMRSDEKSYTEMALKSVNRMDHMIEQALQLIRLENSEIKSNMERFSILELIYDITACYSMEIEINSPKENTFITGDISLIERAIRNILDNTLKYNYDDVSVIINLKRTKHYLEIIISDSGTGIDESDIDRIVERCYRGKSDVDGSGLGLAITNEIMQLHSGYLKILNTYPGLSVHLGFSLTL